MAIEDYILERLAGNEEIERVKRRALSIRVTPDVFHKLELIAHELGVSRHQLMVRMITDATDDALDMLEKELEGQDLIDFDEVLKTIEHAHG